VSARPSTPQEERGQEGPAPISDKERVRRRRSRSIAIAAILGGLVVLFYVITILKLAGDSGASGP